MSGHPSWKSAEIGLFRPCSAFFALLRRVRRAPRKSWKRRKKAFLLRYPQVCLNPLSLKPPFAALQVSTKCYGMTIGVSVKKQGDNGPRMPIHTALVEEAQSWVLWPWSCQKHKTLGPCLKIYFPWRLQRVSRKTTSTKAHMKTSNRPHSPFTRAWFSWKEAVLWR